VALVVVRRGGRSVSDVETFTIAGHATFDPDTATTIQKEKHTND
jgi:hypothetical protein